MKPHIQNVHKLYHVNRNKQSLINTYKYSIATFLWIVIMLIKYFTTLLKHAIHMFQKCSFIAYIWNYGTCNIQFQWMWVKCLNHRIFSRHSFPHVNSSGTLNWNWAQIKSLKKKTWNILCNSCCLIGWCYGQILNPWKYWRFTIKLIRMTYSVCLKIS